MLLYIEYGMQYTIHICVLTSTEWKSVFSVCAVDFIKFEYLLTELTEESTANRGRRKEKIAGRGKSNNFIKMVAFKERRKERKRGKEVKEVNEATSQ